MPLVQANGINLYVETQGHGQPLVLIMGLSYGAWAWWPQVPALAERFQVVTFDNRGAGRSDKPDLPYSVPLMAEDTAALMQALGIARAHVLGHSLGGFIAQELALRRPELVDRLVLCGTSFGGPNAVPVTPPALAVLLNRLGDTETLYRRGIQVAMAPDYAAAHPEAIERIVTQRLADAQPGYAYNRQVAAPFTFNTQGRLGHLQAPTLILAGENDLVVPAANAALMAAEIPDARVFVFPHAGHLFPIEQADLFNRTVIDFLKEG